MRFIAFLAMSAGCCAAGAAAQTTVLQVPHVKQAHGWWCWAAAAEMVTTFLGRPVRQCKHVSDTVLVNCCVQSLPTACMVTGWPNFSRYQYGFAAVGPNALPADQLVQQIASRTPPLFAWQYEGGSGAGHMLVVSGYTIRNGAIWLVILDPRRSTPYEIPYPYYVADPGRHKHARTYYNIRDLNR